MVILCKLANMADEDVVFVNSPLYEHLTETGFTDFNAQTLDNSPKSLWVDKEVESSAGSYGYPINRSSTEMFVDSLCWMMTKICGYILRLMSPCTVYEEIAFHASYVSLIKSSNLLTDDDLEFLYKVEQCDAPADSEMEISQSWNSGPCFNPSGEKPRALFAKLTSNIFIGYVVLIAVILALLIKHDQHLNIVSILLPLGSLLLVCKVYTSWWNTRITRLHNSNLVMLDNYFKIMEELLVLLRKAILFIREKELIIRGHIIVSPVVPVSRLESNPGSNEMKIKQCVMLRKCIFKETKKYLDLLQNQTKAMSCSNFFENLKISGWLDKNSMQIDTDWLNVGFSSDKMLGVDKFSLVALKRIVECLVYQQSLLLTCAMLRSFSVIEGLKKLSRHEKSHLDGIQACFAVLVASGKDCFDKINHCYQFHKVSIPESLLNMEGKKNFRETNVTFSPFTMAIHSLSLHLQEVCKASVLIESKLEETISKTTSVEEFVAEHLDEFKKELSGLMHGLESATLCLEESDNRLQEIFLNLAAEIEVKERSGEEKPTNNNLADQKKYNAQVISIFEKTEAVPDQVFEGETTSELEEQKQGSSTAGKEELFRKHKAREESKCLLQELKSVLATKDGQSMVGIPKALLSRKSEESQSMLTIEKQAIDLDMDDRSRSISLSEASEFKNGDSEYGISKSDGECDEYSGSNHDSSYQQELCCSSNIHDINQEMRCNVVNPFASVVAAAALARNKAFGLGEESYEIEGEAESFGNEVNSDTD